MITIKIIDDKNTEDINIPNHPFKLFGKLIPTYSNEKWGYAEERFPEKSISEMCFPEENYNYRELSKTGIFLGAYDEQKCVGLAILKQAMFKYMYLYDLKVNAEYRGKHIGKMLLKRAKEITVNQGYNGLYTQCQDNNLGACLFYLRNGFVIGGLDTKVYQGTLQENKKDIIFYCDVIG